MNYKFKLIIVAIILVSLTVSFVFIPPAKYFSNDMQSLTIYATSSAGLILEIIGFLLFMMIEKKAVFTEGDFAGGKPMVDGKPLEKDEHIVIRNIKYEKRAIDLVVIGLLLQLVGIFYGIQLLF